jgi:hypothetical protein
VTAADQVDARATRRRIAEDAYDGLSEIVDANRLHALLAASRQRDDGHVRQLLEQARARAAGPNTIAGRTIVQSSGRVAR